MSGFVDKARTVRYEAVDPPVRVEGRIQRQTVPTYGPWFRCYFDAGEESEQTSEGGHRRRRGSTLLARPRDAETGAPIDVLASDLLQIDSPKNGPMLMEVVGAPRPLGKRRARVVEMTLGKTNATLST